MFKLGWPYFPHLSWLSLDQLAESEKGIGHLFEKWSPFIFDTVSSPFLLSSSMSCGSHCLLQVESHHKLDGKSAFQPIRIGKQLSNLLSSSNQNSQSLPRQTETLICKFQPSRLLPNQFQEKSGFHVKMAFQQQKSA